MYQLLKNLSPKSLRYGKLISLTLFFTGCWILIFGLPRQEITPRNDHTHEIKEIPGYTSYSPRAEGDINAPEVEQDIEQIALSLLEGEHAAPSKDPAVLYAKVCSLYEDICNKTARENGFNTQEQFYYQLLAIYLIKKIDGHLLNGSVRQSLDNLLFFKDAEANRGSASHTSVKINVARIETRDEFRDVLTHEFGHTIDLAVLEGKSKTKHSLYTEFNKKMWPIDDPSIAYYRISRDTENVRKSTASFKDFISGYSMKGIYEDFAEHKNARFNHHAVFKKLARTNPILQQKYEFFDDLYGGYYFRANDQKAETIDVEKRVWDSTKMWE